MKGIILAGGLGTRLYPLTKTNNKHLLPVYDKPMIYYPISTLMLAGIRDILIISTPEHLHLFQELLGDGSQWGVTFSYCEQAKPEGLAQAFILAESFIGCDKVCLILGDNLFFGSDLLPKLQAATQRERACTIFTYVVKNPSSYGVVELDNEVRVLSIEEKPARAKSNHAVTGLYFYDNQVVEFAKQIKPSERGELEISDLNALYLKQSAVHAEPLGRGFTWLDMGTHKDLLAAANYIEVLETRQGLKIGVPEELALRMGYITDEDMNKLIKQNFDSEYNTYLKEVLVDA